MSPLILDALIVVGLFVAGFVVSVAIAGAVLVRLPADYFMGPKRGALPDTRHPVIRWTLRILKNLLGIVIVAVGLVLSLPGVPGQGSLLILAGALLVEFPGKYRIERWMIRKGLVHKAADWIRRRGGKPPFQIPP